MALSPLSAAYGATLKPTARTGLSPAGQALGLGDQLRDQAVDETEEARKRRMAQQQYSPAGALLALGGY
jgi:hypothetical protein